MLSETARSVTSDSPTHRLLLSYTADAKYLKHMLTNDIGLEQNPVFDF